MTQDEWNSCTDLASMLAFVRLRASARALQLFAVACCRRVAFLMTETIHREAVEAAERLADGLLTEKGFEPYHLAIQPGWAQSRRDAEVGQTLRYMIAATFHLGTGGGARYAADFAACGVASQFGERNDRSWLAAYHAEESAQCELLREVIGNPFKPFRLDKAWLSNGGKPAVELAQEIYRERRFDNLFMLGKVLDQAGCRDDDVLDHCRQSGAHAKGCWVLDALLEHEPAVFSGLLTAADWQECNDLEPLLHWLRDKGSVRKWRLFAVACCRRIGHLIGDPRSRRAVDVASALAEGAASDEERNATVVVAQQAEDQASRAEWDAEAAANFGITPEYSLALRRYYATAAARSAVCRDPRRTDAEPNTRAAEFWQPSHVHATACAECDVLARFGSTQGDPRWEQASRLAESAKSRETQAQCDLLRDIFRDYFGPTGTVGNWFPFDCHAPGGCCETAEQWCLYPTALGTTLRPEWLTDSVIRLAKAIYNDEAFARLSRLADALEEVGCDTAEVLDHLRGPGPHVRGCWALDLLLGKA